MKWINFLHLYQPVNTDTHNIKEATEKSYKRIIRALEENKNINFTFNVAGCLIQRWEEMGEHELIQRLFSLVKKGQIELTGTAMYHPILPLMPKEEIVRQVKENEKILKKYLSDKYKPKGFFLPEMAYSPSVAKSIKELGYEWIIVDEIICNGKLNQTDVGKIYGDENSGLKLVIRTRSESNTYVPQKIAKLLDAGEEKTVITASDGELYGLRHIDHTGEFEKLLKRAGLETQKISDYIGTQTKIEKIKPISGNWNSSEAEIKRGQPFFVWYNKKNKIQMRLWEMQKIAYTAVYDYKDDDNFYWARWHLVRGLISCNYWWASEKDFMLFSGVTWNPDEIERGINDLTRAVRSLANKETKDIKIEIEKMASELRYKIWEKHWQVYWK
ncbi:MAG: polysaccharide deacetylase family protein [Patescibacteria group bacterium]|jgi:predicted glycosyl hydrolase (DUF1957 family)|nr:polysaccharide deacetylase family protein [Patescibacteria group bacterium]